jgi:NADP-dependent 3-hydroxy acid dehydrogenase YdfG
MRGSFISRRLTVPEANPLLAGKLALVTGATSGIGRATALALAREGATVIATGRRDAALAELVSEAGGLPGKIRPVAGDMADTAFVKRLAADAAAADILCANAGTMTYAPFLDITTEEIEAMFRVNVLSTIHLCQALAKAMAARKAGHIVVMTSLAAREIYTFGSVYSASKHAQSAIVQSMRLELRASHVKVTEVRTGMVATSIRDNVTHPKVLAAVSARPFAPLTAEEVADAVLHALTAGPNVSTDLIEMRPIGS